MSETNPTTNIEYSAHPAPAKAKGRGVRTLGILMLAAGAFTGGMAMRNRVLALFTPNAPQTASSGSDSSSNGNFILALKVSCDLMESREMP